MFYKNNDNITYKIGLYIRLSREDGDDMESESISNQRSLLTGYLKANNLVATSEYIDDGYSGGNFERPSFKRLIRDIEDGLINCVITKDLSRLGRDYIDTGRYIERYFPENNIRYIAVNDDIDTFYETSSSDMMPFRLGMNDMYAKDISKKVRSHLLAMKKEGKFCGSVPPFGYKRDPENKHQLIIDPNTAFIVKEIFDLYVSGYGSCAIAEILTRKEYPTPILLKNSEKKVNNADHPEIWKHSSVNNILRNRVYTGCLIQHTSQNISYKTKKRKAVPKEEWCVFENAHEPIIDIKTFELVQTIRDKSNTYSDDRRDVEYVLSNLVYCKDCGAKMTISYDKKRDRISMNCNNYRKFSKYGFCFSHHINYRKLENTVFGKIGSISSKYINDKEEFEKIIREEYIDPKSELLKKIEQAEKEVAKLERKQDSLYDDKFNGVISADTYQRLFNNTTKEIDTYKGKIDKYKVDLSCIRGESNACADYLEIIQDFLEIKNPTKEMLNKIIEKIEITKDKEIEIHYRVKNAEKVLV